MGKKMEINNTEKNPFLNIPNFEQFIVKYKNLFSKRKYFTINGNFEIIKKEPSFILELANLYYKKKDSGIEKIVKNEFLETYKEKDKRIMRMAKVELSNLIDSFRRALINKNENHSIKLGNELLHRNIEKFYHVIYNLAFMSKDCNKLIKIYYAEKMLMEINGDNLEKMNSNREETDEIVKNVINYFIRSDYEFINFENNEDIKYFKENKADLLYKKIYSENFDELVRKYELRNLKKIKFRLLENKEYETLSESKKKLYDNMQFNKNVSKGAE